MTVRAILFAALISSIGHAQGPQAIPVASGTRAVQLPLSGRTAQTGGVVATQTPVPGVTTSVNTLSTNIQVQAPYSGSVRSAAPAEARLTFSEAIRRGLEYNLGSTASGNTLRHARGQEDVARSALLPSLNATVRENVQQTNLAAFGISLPFGPTVVGPFSYFDLRATLTQTIADFTSINNYRTAKANTEAAGMALRDARDLVVYAVSGAYLQVMTAQARIASVEAQIATAQALFDQLRQQRQVGIVAQLDVNRSQVELQTQQQRLASLRNDLAKQKINLARIVGLSPLAPLEISEQMTFTPAPDLTLEGALAQARENRADLKSAEAQVRAAESARAAARSERLPSLAVSADYGVIGKNPANSHGTFAVMGTLRVPIWQGGRIEGSIAQAEAVLQQRRAELEDLHGRVEADLRAAFLDLESAQAQVELARTNQELAHEALRMAKERLEAGVTTTVEVVQAQQSVSAADLDYITGVFAHNVAKATLARSLGRAEESISRFLPIQ